MRVTSALVVPSADLKMLREALCLAQSALQCVHDSRHPRQAADRLGELIAEIDRHRPVGSDGRHGQLHTYKLRMRGQAVSARLAAWRRAWQHRRSFRCLVGPSFKIWDGGAL